MSEHLKRHHHIGQTVVPYSVDWSEGRETVTLSMDESLELTVRAPMTATSDEIEELLESRQEWILEKLYGLEEQEEPPYPKEYLSGEKLQYRGRQYPLEVVEADVPQPELVFDEQTFTLRTHRFDEGADDVSSAGSARRSSTGSSNGPKRSCRPEHPHSSRDSASTTSPWRSASSTDAGGNTTTESYA